MNALAEKDGKPSFSRKTGAWVVGTQIILTGFVMWKTTPEAVGTVFNLALATWLAFAGALYGINKFSPEAK